MPHTTKIPIYYVRLASGEKRVISSPLTLPQYVWYGNSAKRMPGAFRKALQDAIADECRASEVMRVSTPWELEEKRYTVQLSTPSSDARDKTRRFSQTFDTFTRLLESGDSITYVPAVGIEVFTPQGSDVASSLQDHIQSEYIREKRFSNIGKLIETQWFNEAWTLNVQSALSFYTPAELKERRKEERKSQLSKVAHTYIPSPLALYAREEELSELERGLDGRFPRSVLIVGKEGSGKTALANEYVRRHANTRARFWETTASKFLQGLLGDCGWQQSLALLVSELRESRKILFVGHFSELFEIGQYVGNNISIGEALKDALQRNEILLVAEATEEELAAVTLRAPGVAESFTQVRLREKSDSELEEIVANAVEDLSGRHKAKLESKAVNEILRLQRRYNPYSGMPGKTIRFFESLILEAKDESASIDRGQALQAFCEETSMPPFMVDPNEPFEIESASSFFSSRIFGQKLACKIVSELLASIKTQLARTGKPIASLLLIGPTGVGKTEMAKTLAEYMFGDRRRLIRFDMSEFSDPVAVARLTGEWGSASGSLVGKVREQPFSVVLLDELEKAHYSFYDLLLQILGDGRLTDARGTVANFCSTIVVMTSNLGSEQAHSTSVGFSTKGRSSEEIKQHFIKSVEDFFRPELFNRLDQIVPFNRVGGAELRRIVLRELTRIEKLPGIRNRVNEINVSDDALECLMKQSADLNYGVRGLQRTINNNLLKPLALELNRQQKAGADSICFERDNGSFIIRSFGASTAQGKEKDVERTDSASRYRRRLQKILDGSLYNILLTEFDSLERRSRKPEFWSDGKAAKKFKLLEGITSEGGSLISEICTVEAVVLGKLLSIEKEETVDLDSWSLRYDGWKKNVCAFVAPWTSSCLLGLYSAPQFLPKLLALYETLVELSGYNVKIHAIVLIHEAYRVVPYPLEAENKAAPRVGFLLELEGEAANIYFRPETGFHQWKFAGGRKENAFIDVKTGALKEYEVPENVHRQHFFEALKPRRIISDQVLDDKVYEVQSAPTEIALNGILRQRFEGNLEALLMDEEQ